MNQISRLAGLPHEASPADFRTAMRRLAGGVSVITAGSGSEISGMTVTSVSSLSVDPPSLVVSINRELSSWPLLQRHRHFGVNFLNADQIDIADRFTGKDGHKGADRFAGAEWTERASGVRLLAGALAAIECEAEDIIERHSHAHRHRPCIACGTFRARSRARLLARGLCRHRPGRGHGAACRREPAWPPHPPNYRGLAFHAAGRLTVSSTEMWLKRRPVTCWRDETVRNLDPLRGRHARDPLSRALCLCDVSRARFHAGRPHPYFPQSGRAQLFVTENGCSRV